MDSIKKKFYENQANTIIEKLKMRKMEGYYCDNIDSAKEKILELVGNGAKTIGFGGSMTIDKNGIKDMLKEAGHELIIPSNYKTDDEIKEYKAKTVNADFFMMSTNAITLDGELINIDGRGNRISYMIYGPENVIVVTGMNKVVTDVNEGINRVHNVAAPPNTIRLNCKTPCSITGKCANCLNETICCQTLITRCSRVENRIKVILVGEELGY